MLAQAAPNATSNRTTAVIDRSQGRWVIVLPSTVLDRATMYPSACYPGHGPPNHLDSFREIVKTTGSFNGIVSLVFGKQGRVAGAECTHEAPDAAKRRALQ